MVKRRFQIEGMICVACAMAIDGALEELDSIRSATTSYARQQVDVEYDERALSEAQIVAAIEEVGYTVRR